MKKKPKLNLHERHVIYRSIEKDHKIREISRVLHRSPSTISRELKRNFLPESKEAYADSYIRARYAEDKTKERRSKFRRRKRLKKPKNKGLC